MGRKALAAGSDPGDSASVAQGDAACVLIVDDDADFRSLLRQLVEQCGYRVVGEAADGAEGVAMATALRPDVITMDLEMPRLDGVAATAELCRNGHGIVVIVSGSQSSEQLGEAMRAGARWHVAKRDVVDQLPVVLASLG